jgi:hypothetical protein
MPEKRSVKISKYIVYIFFTIYLIVFGVELSFVYGAPYWVSYLPMLCFLGSGIVAISLVIHIIRSRKPKSRQAKSVVKTKFNWKQSLFIIIFVLSFVPLFSSIVDQGLNNQNFSIHNPYWNGCSNLKTTLEDQDYEVYSVQTDLSATMRMDEKVVLVIMGTNQFYNPIYEMPYFKEFFEANNSLLICHDHGSTSYLLYEAALSSPGSIPVTIFPDGVLRDNASYDKNPTFPIIIDFAEHPTTSGISEVILSRSSCALGGKFIEAFGWTYIGGSSDKYSFIDKNGDGMYKSEDDSFSITGGLLSGLSSLMGGFNIPKIPLGGYPQAVFLAYENYHLVNQSRSRIFCSADASLFNNELINSEYDNKQFALNIFNWLTFGNPSDYIICFDEAHIRPEYMPDVSSAGIFGLFLGYIIHLSTNPLTAFIYPLIGIWTLKRYLPREAKEEEKEKEKKEEEKEEILKFRTSSFFARKINWYKENRKYNQALTLLYRRLERRVNSLLRSRAYTTENIVDAIIEEKGRVNISKINLRRYNRFFDEIILIKNNKKKIKSPEDFQKLFFEMEWALNNI